MGNGIPAKLRPVFLQRLDDIRARRHVSQIKDPTPSKKELLLHGCIEDDHHDASNSYHHHNSIYNNDTNVVKYEEPSKEKDHVRPKQEQESNPNNVMSSSADEGKKDEVVLREEKEHQKGRFNDLMEDSTEDDDDEDDERMIGYDGDDAFPGSPSFRVYFDGDEKDQNPKGDGKNINMVSRNDMPLSKDLELVEGKKVKKGRIKRRSFKGVFPKGGHVKNLLNVTSCYTSCHTSRDHQGAQTRLVVSEKPNKHDS